MTLSLSAAFGMVPHLPIFYKFLTLVFSFPL